MGIITPNDNKFVDDVGKILPQWRPIFDRVKAFFGQITASQIDSLKRLLTAFTTPDADGNTILRDDGTIDITSLIPESDTVFAIDVQNDGVSQDLAEPNVINATQGLEAVGNDISAIGIHRVYPGNVIMPLTGVAPNLGSVNLTNDTIYAMPFYVGQETTVTSWGPLKNGGGISSNVVTNIHADSGNGTPGLVVATSGTVTTTAFTPAGFIYTAGSSVTLPKGLYWVLMVENGTTQYAVVDAAIGFSSPLGGVESGGVVYPVYGLQRSSATISSDESASTWDVAYNNIPYYFPYLAMK